MVMDQSLLEEGKRRAGRCDPSHPLGATYSPCSRIHGSLWSLPDPSLAHHHWLAAHGLRGGALAGVPPAFPLLQGQALLRPRRPFVVPATTGADLKVAPAPPRRAPPPPAPRHRPARSVRACTALPAAYSLLGLMLNRAIPAG